MLTVGFLRSQVQRIRLIRKYAEVLNGFNLSRLEVGDVFVVPEAAAAMLIREGWAELADQRDESVPKPSVSGSR
jgi:hypothetical protein